MNFKYDKWKLFTGRLYTSIVSAHPMWFVIARDMPSDLINTVERTLEEYDF